MIRDSAGNLYGTTYSGGVRNAGVVYELSPTGQETVLYSFTGGADGGYPYAGVIRDSGGNLYGATNSGGTAGYGVVYELDLAGSEAALYSFTGGADGAYPHNVILDASGKLYGSTSSGGAVVVGFGYGVVYELNPAGQETLLYSFAGTDGWHPGASLARDSAGNLYGTTFLGGAYGAGTVYKLTPAGKETVLYSFTGGADGGFPNAGVIMDPAWQSLWDGYRRGRPDRHVPWQLCVPSSGVRRSLQAGHDWPGVGAVHFHGRRRRRRSLCRRSQ